MQDNIETPPSPAAIAAGIGISKRQLERLIVPHLDTPPKRFFMKMRLERARNLPVQNNNSSVDIACACGFLDPGHFSRVYRASFGIAPTAQGRHGGRGPEGHREAALDVQPR